MSEPVGDDDAQSKGGDSGLSSLPPEPRQLESMVQLSHCFKLKAHSTHRLTFFFPTGSPVHPGLYRWSSHLRARWNALAVLLFLSVLPFLCKRIFCISTCESCIRQHSVRTHQPGHVCSIPSLIRGPHFLGTK